MMRLTWFIVLFFCLGPFMLAPVSARVDEEELVRRVRAAQEAVNTAERELQQMQAKYQPAIDGYQAAEAEVARLVAAWQAVRAEISDLDNKEKELPESLKARKDALLDRYSRMQKLYYIDDKSSANKTKLDRSKRKYEEVQRQIRDFNAGNARVKRRRAAARARYDQLWDQYVKARDRLPVQRQDAQSGEDMIAAARAELSSARDDLQKAKSEARWRLNENAPPYLEKVVVKRGGETFYEAEWGASEEQEDAEELLRLAQYLHEDLGRTIPLRRASVKRWADEVKAANEKALAANQAYNDLMDWTSFKNLSKDGILMAISANPLISQPFTLLSGSHPSSYMSHAWRKIGVEMADSVLTTARDVVGGVPPHIAIAAEAVSQVGDVLFRAAQGQSKNPSWAATGSIPQMVSRRSKAERELIEGMTKARIRGALERLRGRVKAALKEEDFRQQLVQQHQGETLAIALTQTTVTQNMPRLEGLKQWNPGGSIVDSTFNFFTQPSGALKTLLKTRFLEGTPGDAPTPFKDIGLDLLQSLVRDMALGQLERERLEVEYAWHAAHVKSQMTDAHYYNERLLREIDMHIQKILAEQLIPELTAEVERLRASRELDIVKDAEVKDEQATLVMTFSNEVDIERVTLADVALAPKQKRDTWQAEIDLDKFEDADDAPLQLTVVARPPAFEERQLDDPRTVASWSTQTSSFSAYEQKPDTYHKIRLTPEEIAGEIAYYPSCIMGLLDHERYLISAENERHWIAHMEKISRGEDSMAGYRESIPQLLFGGGFRKIREKTVWAIFGARLSMLSRYNSELEVLLGKRKRYFYTFPVVSVGFTPDKNKNRLFCIPGQPCYLEKDGGLYSKDNEWLKLAAETHKKAITEFRKDSADEMTRRESDPNSRAPNSPAADRAEAGFFHVGTMMSAAGDGTCEWWAPKLPAWGTTDGLF